VSTAAAVSAAATAPPPAVAVAAQAGAAPTGTAELASIVGKVTTTPPRAAASAVVYLEDAPIVAGPAMTAAIDNRQMAFIPYVQVVPVGGRIVFNNSDPFPHNVFSPGKTGFNLGMVQAKNASAHVFNTPGVFPLLCNLHPNMLAFVVVTPSSYFAKANAKGEFTLKDVPAGTYKITAWAPREQPQTQSVVVQGSELALNFDLHK
jgi:plastocyanin